MFFGKESSRNNLLHVVFLAAFSILNIAFISNYSSGLIIADHWRHFAEILIPLSEGGQSFKLFWANHHPNPILHLHELTYSKFFNFDLKYDAYLSFTLHVAMFLFLFAAFLRNTSAGNEIGKVFVFAGVGAFWFGILTPHTFLWTLISLQSLGYIFGILLAVLLTLYSRSPGSSRRSSVLISSVCILGVLLNFDYGVLFFVSTFLAIFVHILWNRDWKLFKSLAVVTCSSVIGILTIKFGLIGSSGGGGFAIWDSLKALPEFIRSFFLSVASGLYGEVVFRPSFFSPKGERNGLLMLVSVFSALLYLALAMRALKLKRLGLPFLALMIYPAIFSYAVFVSRDSGDFSIYLGAPRYATNFKIGWMAALFVAGAWGLEWAKGKPSRVILGAMTVLCSIYWCFVTSESFKIGQYWEATSNRDEVIIYMAGTEQDATIILDSTIVGGNINYQKSLTYLTKNQLNVFSDEYSRGELLEKHIANKTDYVENSGPVFSFALEVSDNKDQFKQECVQIASQADKAFKLRLEHIGSPTKRIFVYLPTGKAVERHQALPGENIFFGKHNKDNAKICVSGSVRQKNVQD